MTSQHKFAIRVAPLFVAASVLAGCQQEKLINLFAAGPDSVVRGQPATLVFSGAEKATLAIDQGVGDVTGKTQVSVTPLDTTTYTLTATKDGKSQTATVTVTVGARPATGFALSAAEATLTAGTATTVTLKAVGRDGTVLNDYVGTVGLVSDDPSATLPASVTFAAGDAGQKTFSATFKAAGDRVLIATDAGAAGAQGVLKIPVVAAAASALELSADATSVRAGDTVALLVTAKDAFGNVATRYAGTLRFSSGDAAAILPADTTFAPADAGRHAFSVSFRTAGTFTVTAAEPAASLSATTGSISVRNAPAARLELTGPAQLDSGTAATVTATLSDRFGNRAVDYAGTLAFTTTDPGAGTIPNAVFATADQGSKAISVTLATAGAQAIAATDTQDAALTAVYRADVRHGAAAAYQLSALPAAATAGDPLSVTITAVDSHGNVVKSYAGTAHVSSADATDLLPSDGGFVNGVRTASISFVRVGNHAVTVGEVGGTLSATSGSTAVRNASAATVQLQGPASVVAGAAGLLTATLFDRFGNVAADYAGTLAFATTDSAASIPSQAFTPADLGTKQVSFTLVSAGARSIAATDTSNAAITATHAVSVQPGGLASFSLSALPASARAGDSLPLTITALDAHGNVATGYAGQAHVSSADATDVLPADGAFTAGVRAASLSFRTAGDHSVAVGEVGGTVTATSTTVTVRNAAASALALAGPPAATSNQAVSLTATAMDPYGNVARDYLGTLSFTTSDAAAPPIANVTFTAGDQGARSVSATLLTAGDQTITATDTANGALTASRAIRVAHGPLAAFLLSPLPATARAGEPVSLTITAVDAHGNVLTDYAGQAHVSSGDATDVLPADGGFLSGVRVVSLAFVRTGDHGVTVAEVGGTLTATSTSTAVRPAPAAALQLFQAVPALNPGDATGLTVTVRDAYGNTVTDYAGTVGFTATDPGATLPAAYTFVPADAGAHDFSITFAALGVQRVTAAAAEASATAQWTLSPVGIHCALDASDTPVAGVMQGGRITILDAAGNTVTTYTGAFVTTSSDPTAQLMDFTVDPVDQGTRLFGWTMFRAGAQQITVTNATDGVTCSRSLTLAPGPARLHLSLASDVNAGAPVVANLAVADDYGNAWSTYAGTLTLTSTDAAAILPGAIVFDGSEGGVASAQVTFNTMGAQTLTAAGGGLSASAGATVHGLVYTNPANGQGKVRLVVNAAASTASEVQLDLVSNVQLIATSSGGRVRGGIYGAGINLPVDTTRAVAGTPLMIYPPSGAGITPTALSVGTGVTAVAAALPTSGPTANVLYTGVSQKAAGAGFVSNDVSLRVGQTFYSVRLHLRPTAAVGKVFDANALGAKFRAAVRSASGGNAVTQNDFAIGTLEVR